MSKTKSLDFVGGSANGLMFCCMISRSRRNLLRPGIGDWEFLSCVCGAEVLRTTTKNIVSPARAATTKGTSGITVCSICKKFLIPEISVPNEVLYQTIRK